MATQTKHIAHRSTTVFRVTGKANMIAACCGLVLLSAVAAHAGFPIPTNGLPMNGMPFNGMPYNGIEFNGMPFNGMPRNGMPYNGLMTNGLHVNSLSLNSVVINGGPMNELLMNGTGAQDTSYSSQPLPRMQSDTLPWANLSHKALGKTSH